MEPRHEVSLLAVSHALSLHGAAIDGTSELRTEPDGAMCQELDARWQIRTVSSYASNDALAGGIQQRVNQPTTVISYRMIIDDERRGVLR